MAEKDLDTRFLDAVTIADDMSQAMLPQDIQLRLYAYYKQATHGTIDARHSSNFDLRNAFKTNAWMQISHLTEEEAKEEYIKIINSITNKTI
jgi:acyl-CoA-binding protein